MGGQALIQNVDTNSDLLDDTWCNRMCLSWTKN